MNFKFNVTANAFDFFKLSMKLTYTSPLGVCNIVVFAAALFATIKLYPDLNEVFRGVMIFLCLLFPVVQPLGIYMRSKKHAAAMPKDMTMEATANGLLVHVGEKSEVVDYAKIKGIKDTGDCLVIRLGGGTGFCLFNRVMGDQKSDFIEYLKKKTA